MTRIIQIGLKNRIYIFWIDEFTDTNKLVILGIKTFKVFRQTTYGIMRRKSSRTKKGSLRQRSSPKIRRRHFCCHGEGLPSCKSGMKLKLHWSMLETLLEYETFILMFWLIDISNYILIFSLWPFVKLFYFLWLIWYSNLLHTYYFDILWLFLKKVMWMFSTVRFTCLINTLHLRCVVLEALLPLRSLYNFN